MSPNLETTQIQQQPQAAELSGAQSAWQFCRELGHNALASIAKSRLVRSALALGLAASAGAAAGMARELAEPKPTPAYAAETGGYPDWDKPCVVGDPMDPNSSYGKTQDTGYWCSGYQWGNSPSQQNSSRGYGYRNCTDYVAWVVEENTDLDIGGLGHATLWDNNAASKGLRVRSAEEAPQIGDIAHKEGNDANPSSDYGLVGIVVSVNPLIVAEYNGGRDGNYRTRTNPTDINHYIAVPGLSGVGLSKPYSTLPNGQEFYSENWVYTKVGGSAWPITPKSTWNAMNAADKAVWGGTEPVGPVPIGEVHDHEAGYGGTAAHPPRNGTALYVAGGNGQQYYFMRDKALRVDGDEVDGLGIRDQALPIPGGRLGGFIDNEHPFTPANGDVYRFATEPEVRQAIYEGGWYAVGYHVNTDTVKDCLRLTQGKEVILLPRSARYNLPVVEVSDPARCTFPPSTVLRGPGGQEQWRLEGNNPYTRRYYPDALTTHLHTSGSPTVQELSSTTSLNNVAEGPWMTIPEGIVFVDNGNGAEFLRQNSTWHHVPYPAMNQCLGITPGQIIHVPSTAVGVLAQGEPMTCEYDNRMLTRPDGRTYWVEGGRKHYIGNPAIRDCLQQVRATGPWTAESNAKIDTYTDSTAAYCEFERDHGVKFVKEQNSQTIYFVEDNGTLRHAGSVCVADWQTTKWKQFRVWEVATGMTARPQSQFGPAWFATPAACDALPRVWMG